MDLLIDNIDKANVFSSIFKLLHNLSKDVNLQFSKDGLYIQAMDSNHVCLTELRMSSSWFTTYNVKSKKASIMLGVNLDILSKILKCKDKNQTIRMSYDSKKENLDISFKNKVSESGEKQTETFDKDFEIPLMDIDSDILDIPDSEYEADFSLRSSMFQNISNEMNMFSENVKFHVSEEEIYFTSKGDYGKYKVKLSIDDIDDFSIEEDKSLKMDYNLKYFVLVSTFNQLAKHIHISVSENYPLKMKYEFDRENEDNNIVFYLAPKIDQDED